MSRSFLLYSAWCVNFTEQCLCHFHYRSVHEEIWEGMFTFSSGDRAISTVSSVFAFLPAYFLISQIIHLFGLSKSTWASCCGHVFLDIVFIERKIFIFTLISREPHLLSGNLYYFYVCNSLGVLTATHRLPESVHRVVISSRILPDAIIY